MHSYTYTALEIRETMWLIQELAGKLKKRDFIQEKRFKNIQPR